MLEGPLPLFRAVRRGLFEALPSPWKAALARRHYRLPKLTRHRLAMDGNAVETAGEVSVILPVYNQSELLAESIESVLAQTHAKFELIILDDGSTDGIESVLASFMDDPRVRILTQQNRKLPAALSNAFRFARGEFHTWTSADNVMERTHLERLVEFLRDHPTAAMVYADYIVIGPDGQPLRGSDFRPQNRSSSDSAAIRVPRSTETLNLLQDNFIGACFLYRGWVGRCLGPYSSSLGIEDYDYWMRINAEFGIEHLGTDELLYRYRWHDNSLNAQSRELKFFEIGKELMRHERERTAWRAEPWTILTDSAGGWSVDSETEPFSLSTGMDGKCIALLSSESLAPEDLDALPDHLVLAIDWTGDPASAYRWANRLRDDRLVHFPTSPAMARALGLFTERVFEIDRGDERLALALAYGNERIAAWRSGHEEETPLPRVFCSGNRRVLLQTNTFGQGGLECVVLDLASSLAPFGFECQILVLGKQGRMADVARSRGIEIVTLEEATAEAYASLLSTRDIGLVLAHHSLFGAEAAHHAGVPFVQTLHNTYHWFYPEEIKAWRQADAATAAYLHVSANVAMYAHEKIGLSVDKSIVLENGVRLPSPTTSTTGEVDAVSRKTFGLDDDDYVFLNVASIYPPKSQVPIARALAKAREKDPRLKVVLLGRAMDNVYAKALEHVIAELDLRDHLVVAGFHADTEPFYELADAFLLPSYWEGCSLAVDEALVRDLPCVLTDVGAARQQMRPDEGILVRAPFASITGLDYGNLKESLATPREGFVEDLAAALVAAAQREGRLPADPSRSERFDIAGVAERYARILTWIHNGGRPAQARPFAWAGYHEGELR